MEKGIRTMNNIQEGIQERIVHYEQLLPQVIEIDSLKIKLSDTSEDIQSSLGYTYLVSDKDATKKVFTEHIDKSLKLLEKDTSIDGQGTYFENEKCFLVFKTPDEKTLRESLKARDRLCSFTRDSVDKLDLLLNKYGAVNLDDFLAGITENELFRCTIVRDDSLVYYSDNSSIINAGASFRFDHKHLNNVSIDTLVVNGSDYVSFNSRINLIDQELFLSGLMPLEEYTAYTRDLSYVYWLVLLLLTSVVVVASPTIKIFVINTWERLKNSDAAVSIFGFLAIVFFGSILFASISRYLELKQLLDESLYEYNNQLSDQFREEIQNVVNRISYEKLFKDVNSNGTILSNIEFHEAFRTVNKKADLKDLLNGEDHFVIDGIYLPYSKKGFNENDVVNKIFQHYAEVRNRKYISELVRGKGYRIKCTPSRKSYLQSVFSYSRGQTEAVISAKIDTNTVHAISLDLKSLMSNVPPEGLGYALIDQNFNVVFSSKKAINNFRSLSKDIIGGDFIEYSLKTQKPDSGSFEYGKDAFRGYIAPVEAFTNNQKPFYLLTFGNTKLFEWQSATSTLLTFSLGLSIPLALLIFLIFNYFFCIRYKRRALHEKIRPLEFLVPNAKNIHTYRILTLTSFIYGVIFFVSFKGADLPFNVSTTITTILTIGGISQILSSPEQRFKTSSFIWFALILLLVSGIVIWLVSDGNIDWRNKMIFSLHALFLLSSLLLRVRIKSLSIARDNARRAYTVHVFSWLFNLVVLPLILISNTSEIFSKTSFEKNYLKQHEAAIALNQEQANVSYANYDRYNKDVKNLIQNSSLRPTTAFFEQGVDPKKAKYSENDGFELIYTSIINVLENRYEWYPPACKVENHTGFINWQKGWAFICFVIFILLLYATNRFYLKKLFFNTPIEIQRRKISYSVQKDVMYRYFQGGLQNERPFRLLLVGPSKSGRVQLLHDAGILNQVAPGVYDLVYIDLGKNTDWLDDDFAASYIPREIKNADTLIVRFWQPDTINENFIGKLAKLRRYFSETYLKEKKIVLFSSRTITQLEEEWSQLRGMTDDQNSLIKIRDELQVFLYPFREFVIPIHGEIMDDSKYVDRYGMNELKLYLNKSYYSPLYLSIWNSLSMEERFILYDLSDDFLVNTHNKNALYKLYFKGLIKYNPYAYRLEIFQQSFAYFIKTGVPTDELIEMEKLSSRNGTWKSIRLSIIILILLLVGLTYTVNPGVLNGLVGIAGIIATTFAAFSQVTSRINIPSIGGIFGNKG